VIIRATDAGGTPYGVLGIHTARPRNFTEHDIRFLQAAANLVTAALQRERTEAALRDRKARLRTLVEAMPQLAFSATPDGLGEYQNQRWHDYTGQTADEAKGGGWAAALHTDDRDATLAAWSRALASGEAFEQEHRLRGRDSRYRRFLTRAVPERTEDGGVVRWLGTSTDIAAIAAVRDAAVRLAGRLKARVADRTRALTEAAEELGAEMRRRQEAQTALLQSQKLEALGQLTAGVAHDFNNLLAGILGSFELIERRTGEPRVIEMVGRGKAAATRAASLTRQLLDFGRREPAKSVVLTVETALRGADELVGHAVGPGITRVLDVQPAHGRC